MTDRYELASAIFGTKRAETDPSSLSTAIITGTAVEDSESGMVRIIPDGNVIAPEGEDNSIVLPTSPNVKSGDNVIIISTGGTATTPIVAGASGSGDRVQSAADAASQAASQVQQDIADFKSGADVDYAIYEYVDDEVGELSTTVSATYLSKTDAQTTYATKSQLTQTAEDITASVSQNYVSKSDAQTTYATKSELTVGLDGITSEVSQTYATKTEAATTGSGSGESVEVADGAGLRSLTVYGKSVQDGTPTPDAPVEIRTVSGANLLPKMTAGTYGANGITIEVDSNGVATLSGTATANGNAAIIPLEQAITITQQMVDDGVFVHYNNSESNANAAPNFESSTGVSAFSYALAPANRTVQLSSSHVGKTIDRVRFWLSSGVTLSGTFAPALVADSSTVPYIPYGSIGLKVSGIESEPSLYKNGYSINASGVEATTTGFAIRTAASDGAASAVIGLTKGNVTKQYIRVHAYDSSGTWLAQAGVLRTAASGTLSIAAVLPNGTAEIRVSAATTVAVDSVMLDYVTPIDLQGNVLASLPDGTKDVLTVDETGHCVITKNTNHIASYNGESVGSVYIATTGTLETGAEVYYKRSTATTVDLGYITMPELVDGCTVGIIASLTPTIDAGWYTGNGSAIYEQSTRITQTEQDVTTAITGVTGLQTMVRQYGNGVLVCRTGNSIGALVNADGSFDVVSVTWNGDVPTAGDAVATFGSNSVTLGVAPDAAISGGDSSVVRMNGGLFQIISGIVEALDYCINQINVDSTQHVYNELSMHIDGDGFHVGKNRGASRANIDVSGNVHIEGPTAAPGEIPGADYAITRAYTASGFAVENAVFHATADIVVVPFQFTATSNVTMAATTVATIPAAYAPKEEVRCPIWCSPDWTATNFKTGYANIDSSGNIKLTAPAAKYWFGQAVWIRL